MFNPFCRLSGGTYLQARQNEFKIGAASQG